MNTSRRTVLALGLLASTAVLAQGAATDNMTILKEKLHADKKLLVAANMDLTDEESAKFWPVYESYQRELSALNQRVGKLIASYASDYRANTLTDEKAGKLIDEMLAIDDATLSLEKSYVPKLKAVLPTKKVARYLQLENKMRAVARYELAAQIPLVE